MTSNVMKAFRDRIGSRDWLDEETSTRAQRKVLAYKLGYEVL